MKTHRTGSVHAFPRIVLDGAFFQFDDPGGIARVWSALLEEWSDTPFGQSILVLDREGAVPKFSGIAYLPVKEFQSNFAASESFALEAICREQGASLFISTFYTTPLETPSVRLVHDLIAELMPDMEHPKWAEEKRFCTYHASAYIAVSHNTAHDLHAHYPFSSSFPLCVAHNGVSKAFRPLPPDAVHAFRQRYGITRPYLLWVGRRHGYKNGDIFFESFGQWSQRNELAIVCCERGGILAPHHRQYVGDSEVHMLSLDDAELNAAYNGALALVYPSKYEGFGLPVVEAMAAGCPVITCRNSAIPEVAGDAVLYVRESSVNDMLDAMAEVQDKAVRDRLVQAGIERARLFSWSATAKVIRDFLSQLAWQKGGIAVPTDANLPLSASQQRWRELRSCQQSLESSRDRLQDLLRLPRLQQHLQSAKQTAENDNDSSQLAQQQRYEAVVKLRDLESRWLDAISESRVRFSTVGGATLDA